MALVSTFVLIRKSAATTNTQATGRTTSEKEKESAISTMVTYMLETGGKGSVMEKEITSTGKERGTQVSGRTT